MNYELEKIAEWLRANKLSVNINKTEYMVFRSLRKHIPGDASLKINGKVVKSVLAKKFLGVILDYKLSWCEHIQYIKNKISKGIGIHCKARKIFKTSSLINLYYIFVYPYLQYFIEIWGKSSNIYLNSITKLQKRAVRIIVSASYKAHTSPIFVKLEILPLYKIHLYCTIIYMFKCVNKLLPPIFDDLFLTNKDIHHYGTRQKNKLHVPKAKLSISQKSIRYIGVSIWNFIAHKIPYHSTLFTYKQKLKCYLLLIRVCTVHFCLFKIIRQFI